jgi:hypothetical protein
MRASDGRERLVARGTSMATADQSQGDRVQARVQVSSPVLERAKVESMLG